MKNLTTGKAVHIKSAQRLRGFAKGTLVSAPVEPEAAVPSQPATKAKATHTTQPAATIRLSALDAAAKVLSEAPEPMRG